MHPLVIVLWVAGAVSAACWILSLITKDTSWVDRIWSIVPVAYVWIFAGAAIGAGDDAIRLIVMGVLVTLWGARLTANFARKGGYSGREDYRWAVLRGRMHPAAFQAFNLFFIVLYQNALLVLITLPALVAVANPAPLGAVDIVLAVLFLGFLVGETIADQQQWAFQQRKHAAGGMLAPGFITTGMFRYSRHPNFFFEQMQWWAFYGLGASAAAAAGRPVFGGVVNWSLAGALLLTVLFVGSTIFTESISAAKYPAYADYRRSTSALVPAPPRRLASSAKRPSDSLR